MIQESRVNVLSACILYKSDGEGDIVIKVKDIAELAGVSAATVSYVLNGKSGVSENKRKYISSLLEEHGYTIKNTPFDTETGISDYSKTSGIIQFVKYTKEGFFVDRNGDFITRIIDSAEKTSRHRGYSLGMLNVSDSSLQVTFEDLNRNDAVIGVIFLGTEFDSDDADLLKILKKPLVVVDSRMGYERFNCISMNERDGVYSAISHLKELGHKRITFLRSLVRSEENYERELGFELSLRELDMDSSKICYLDVLPNIEGSFHVVSDDLDDHGLRSTAFFAASDLIAIGAIRALKEHGYSVPKDASVIGFDGLSIGAALEPPLSTMAIDKNVIGELAVKRLIDLINTYDSYYIKTQVSTSLIIRKTTAPYVKSNL